MSRLEYGVYGDFKHIGSGVYELRFFFGGGYRVYFTEESNKIIIVLNGGDKDSQQKDVKKAQELLREYLKEN
jgi:putative addiction module killer protein